MIHIDLKQFSREELVELHRQVADALGVQTARSIGAAGGRVRVAKGFAVTGNPRAVVTKCPTCGADCPSGRAARRHCQ